MYPYRIRITDPPSIEILKTVSNFRAVKTTSNITKKVGHKIPRKIKRDGFHIKDGVVALTNPRLILDFKPAYGKRKGYDFTIKSIF